MPHGEVTGRRHIMMYGIIPWVMKKTTLFGGFHSLIFFNNGLFNFLKQPATHFLLCHQNFSTFYRSFFFYLKDILMCYQLMYTIKPETSIKYFYWIKKVKKLSTIYIFKFNTFKKYSNKKFIELDQPRSFKGLPPVTVTSSRDVLYVMIYTGSFFKHAHPIFMLELCIFSNSDFRNF